jgi:hypothetical protein
MKTLLYLLKAAMKKLLVNLHWLFIAATTALVWSWLDHGLAKNFDVLKPIVEGVIGGVVTALLLLVFATLWKTNITPWFENITYRDAKIEGVWHGFLVPYMGIEEIDRLRVQAAWRKIMNGSKSPAKQEQVEDTVPVEASVVSSDGDKLTSSAELILPPREQSATSSETEPPKKRKTITIALGAQPIRVRAEFWRVGHKVEGRFIEIGGASEVHTYYVVGTFRNLILCGRYQNENPQNIDRGSFSLMLKANGGRFEGFFASYADEQHKIHPFRCVLKRSPTGSHSAVAP